VVFGATPSGATRQRCGRVPPNTSSGRTAHTLWPLIVDPKIFSVASVTKLCALSVLCGEADLRTTSEVSAHCQQNCFPLIRPSLAHFVVKDQAGRFLVPGNCFIPVDHFGGCEERRVIEARGDESDEIFIRIPAVDPAAADRAKCAESNSAKAVVVRISLGGTFDDEPRLGHREESGMDRSGKSLAKSTLTEDVEPDIEAVCDCAETELKRRELVNKLHRGRFRLWQESRRYSQTSCPKVSEKAGRPIGT
jgi:hypothetical protein